MHRSNKRAFKRAVMAQDREPLWTSCTPHSNPSFLLCSYPEFPTGWRRPAANETWGALALAKAPARASKAQVSY